MTVKKKTAKKTTKAPSVFYASIRTDELVNSSCSTAWIFKNEDDAIEDARDAAVDDGESFTVIRLEVLGVARVPVSASTHEKVSK